MQKPSKEPKETRELSYLLETYTSYSPSQLRSIADLMEQNNLLFLEIGIEGDYGDSDFTCHQIRMETEQEAEKRFKRETKEYNKYLEMQKKVKDKKKEKLIKEAKKLGLKVVDE